MLKKVFVSTVAESPRRTLLRLAALMLITGLVASGGLALTGSVQRVAVIWPLNGLYLALLLRAPQRQWPQLVVSVWLGNLLADCAFGDPPWLAFGLSALNQLEVLLSAYGLARRGCIGRDLSRARSLSQFVLLAVIAAPLLSGLLAAVVLHGVSPAPWYRVALRWYAADALGSAIVTPLALALRPATFKNVFIRRRLWRNLLPLTVLATVTVAVFLQSQLPLLFLIFPPLMWCVLQMGLAGGAVGLTLVTALSIEALIDAHGPLQLVTTDTLLLGSSTLRLLVLQLLLFTAAATMLILSAVITQRERLRRLVQRDVQRFRALSNIDGLTAVANRRCFDAVLDVEWRRAHREGLALSVLMIDVDYFKSYNDRYGHLAGDDALRAIALALRGALRRAGDLVARFGGEEFAVVLPHTPPAQAAQVGVMLCRAVRDLQIEHLDCTVYTQLTVSLGCAGLTDVRAAAPFDSQDLLHAADVALYRAKRDGRDRVALQTGEILSSDRPPRGQNPPPAFKLAPGAA